MDIREGWAKFYPAVHSFIGVPRFGGGSSEFHTFTGPTEFQELDPSNLDRIIALNTPLYGPVPYVGGDLNVKIGLFSIKESDFSGPFLNMVSSVASAVGCAYVSVAMPVVDSLKKGIESLTNTDKDSRLEIGLVKTFDAPTTAYYAVIRATPDQVDVSKLRIDNSYKLVDNMSGQPISDFPYLVFAIESSTERSDWADIPDLKQAYADLTTVVNDVKSDEATVQAAFVIFRRKVKSSAESSSHRMRILFSQRSNSESRASQVTLRLFCSQSGQRSQEDPCLHSGNSTYTIKRFNFSSESQEWVLQ